MKRSTRLAALLLLCLPALGADPAAQNLAVKAKPGEFVVEHPTLINLGFEWVVEGDDNRNSRVEVSYRAQGATDWRSGLPLLRLQGERIFQTDGVFNVVSPNMFAGSILDLEPDTVYEARFVLSDPDGLVGQRTGTSTRTVTVRTRAEPKPFSGGRVFHVYPPNHKGTKIEPAFEGLMCAYNYYCGGGDTVTAGRPRVKAGDVVLVHAGLYKYSPEFYTGDRTINATTPFEGTYYLTASGTPERPIAIKSASDGDVIFDGNGNFNLFNVKAANYTYFEGITIRNTDIAIWAGTQFIAGSKGLTVKKCRIEDVNLGIFTNYSGSSDFYIADSTFIGRDDPKHLFGWNGAFWAQFTGVDGQTFPPELASYTAVRLYGPGHVVAYNHIADFHDGVDIETYGNPDGSHAIDGPYYPRRDFWDKRPVAIDFYNNYMTNFHDNAFEIDGSMHNVRVMRNMMVNSASHPFCNQPAIGGPVYWIRNIAYHAPGGSTRLTNGSAGVLFYNNTILTETSAGSSANVHWRNNLILGENSAPAIFSVNTNTNYSSSDYNGFRANPGAPFSFEWNSPPSSVQADYSGLVASGGRSGGPAVNTALEGRRFATLAEYSQATRQDLHSTEVDYGVFVHVPMLDAKDLQKVQMVYRAEDLDFGLKPGSAAIDRGMLLPNVTDGFAGKAPDLGALESGEALRTMALDRSHHAMRTRLVLLSLCIVLTAQTARTQQDHRTWKDYGGGPDSSHFVALNQITKSNVSQLEVAWIYPTGDNRSYIFNPIVVDNVMYVLAKNSSLVALDAATGKEIWIHENLPGLTTRGIAYWEGKDRKDRRLIFTINSHLQEIDARTGKSILTFGNNGLVDLREGLGRDPGTIVRIQPESPGRVFENLIMLGSATGESYLSPPGDIRAYNVVTGKLVWTFHTIPHPGEVGYDTWPKDAWRYAGGANTWGEITVDEKRGIAYFPTGSPTYDYYGADRIGSNLFANSLLALDARTGKRLWHFQLVHHDLWDYDTNAAPQLITVRHDGKRIDAVSQATKQGFLFVFDRVTGTPLWPIEERPVPKSNMPGEQAWPTQPFPTAPPPFARQRMTADDVNPFILTAEERAAWKDRISKMRNEGLFTPPGLEETVSLPGARGGSNWGASAANPDKGLVYLTTQDWPTIYKLNVDDPLAARRGGAASAEQGKAIYEDRCQACHGIDGAGSAGGPPPLAGTNRLGFDAFRQVVLAGRTEMPAFADLEGPALTALHAFLGGPDGASPSVATGGESRTSAGPVVASGGAPGGLHVPEVSSRSRYSPLGGPAYPAGVESPANRYYTDWGLYPNQAYVIGPPWSAIVAYDLNSGTMRWRVPLGEDARAVKEGAKHAGAFMAERHGIIVTATGLLFVATTDGKVRAHDEETGAVLWTAALPAGSEGLPAMYEVNGRQFLVVPASSRINTGGGHRGPGAAPPTSEARSPQAGYVAFALPRRYVAGGR